MTYGRAYLELTFRDGSYLSASLWTSITNLGPFCSSQFFFLSSHPQILQSWRPKSVCLLMLRLKQLLNSCCTFPCRNYACVHMLTSVDSPTWSLSQTWLVFNANLLFCWTGTTQTKVTYLPDGAVVVVFPSNLTVAIETGGHPIMENEHRMHYKRKVIVPDHYMHRLEWRFYLRRKRRTRQSRIVEKIGHRMRVGALSRLHDSHEDGIKEKALLVCVSQPMQSVGYTSTSL